MALRLMRALLILIPALALAGCVSAPGGAPGIQRTSTREYRQVASCAYGALDRAYPGKIRMVDLRSMNQMRLTLADGAGGLIGSASMRAFEMTVSRAGAGSLIEINAPPTVIGSNPNAERTWQDVQACA